MIKINLLQEAKGKRRSSSEVKGEQSLLVGFGVIAAAGAAVFFLVHSPLADEIEEQNNINNALAAQNKKIEQKTSDFEKRQKALQAAKQQAASIEQLNGSRATPAWFMWELAKILTRGNDPTITPAMQRRLDDNENLRWQDSWDPKHIWIGSVEEEKGRFTLRGSAQSDGDVTQLAHRLSASMYFEDVQPERSAQNTDTKSGISYYKFTITGQVRY